jgi:hypothetical protein
VVPRLLQLLNRDDLDLQMRATVVAALARIEPDSPAVLPALRSVFAEIQNGDAADSSYMSEVSDVTEAIVHMGHHARPLLADLVALCEHAHLLSFWYRCDAAYAAARIDPGQEAALKYLKWAARHGDFLVGQTAQGKLDELKSPPESSK